MSTQDQKTQTNLRQLGQQAKETTEQIDKLKTTLLSVNNRLSTMGQPLEVASSKKNDAAGQMQQTQVEFVKGAVPYAPLMLVPAAAGAAGLSSQLARLLPRLGAFLGRTATRAAPAVQGAMTGANATIEVASQDRKSVV